MEVTNQLPTIPLSALDIDLDDCELIIKINEDNSFYVAGNNLVLQVDGIDVWRWEVDEINTKKIRDFLEQKIAAWNEEDDFEPCQWFTDEYF